MWGLCTRLWLLLIAGTRAVSGSILWNINSNVMGLGASGLWMIAPNKTSLLVWVLFGLNIFYSGIEYTDKDGVRLEVRPSPVSRIIQSQTVRNLTHRGSSSLTHLPWSVILSRLSIGRVCTTTVFCMVFVDGLLNVCVPFFNMFYSGFKYTEKDWVQNKVRHYSLQTFT